jgi:hypothetical protein
MKTQQLAATEASVEKLTLGNWQSNIWTTVVGIIETVDLVENTCSVQPAIMLESFNRTGKPKAITLPLLVDCPLIFPSGGGVVLTFPVKEGDECLVHISSRAIDGWWQSGGIQKQPEYRMHDLSDGFAQVGVRSLPNAIQNISSTATQLRSEDGTAYYSLDSISKVLTISAPNGLVINGDITQTGNLTSSGTITGTTNVVAGTKALKAHTHPVTTAPGTSGVNN